MSQYRNREGRFRFRFLKTVPAVPVLRSVPRKWLNRVHLCAVGFDGPLNDGLPA